MDEIIVKDIDYENIDDLCNVCVPPEKRKEPEFLKGIEEKRKWVNHMLTTFGVFAKIAYLDDIPVGQIQYKPIPDKRILYIYCIYVPENKHWKKGIATKLLNTLIEDMKKPSASFKWKSALALVTKAFSGESEGQYYASSFFKGKGFFRIEGNPDFFYYPLDNGFSLNEDDVKEISKELFWEQQKIEYVYQNMDKEKAVIIYGPSFCPYHYLFLKKAEAFIKQVAPHITIRWISESEEPEEVKKRGDFKGCIVNGKPIKSFVFEKEAFLKEVTEALNSPYI